MASGAVSGGGVGIGSALKEVASLERKRDMHVHTGGFAAQNAIGTFACDLVVGAEGAVKDLFKGVVTLITHPLQSLKGLAALPVALVTRPGDVARAFTEPYSEAIRAGRPGQAIGRGIVEIGNLLLGVKTVSGLVRGGAHAAHMGGTAAGVAMRTGQAANAAGLAAMATHAAHLAGAAGAAAHATHKAGVAASGAAKLPADTQVPAPAVHSSGDPAPSVHAPGHDSAGH